MLHCMTPDQSTLSVFVAVMGVLGLEGQVLGLGLVPKSLFPSLLHGILFLSVALSTVERQCSREAAFFPRVGSTDVQWS